VEVDFRNTPGVTAAEVGDTGGHKDNRRQKEVRSGQTGHAKAVEVTFDPSEISYADLTQVNRQGWDVGTQYRSAIFTRSPEQADVAAARAQARFPRPIATEIVPATMFWPAEKYHQQYLVNNGRTTRRI
jgi:methionine-S-sulfoxide reductase